MENYYFWLSARRRRNVLLLTFIKSWKWTLPSLLIASIGYLLLHDYLEASPFNAFFSLVTSFSLFAVVKYKEKLEKKKLFIFRACYMATTGIILFWIMIALGLLNFGYFLSLALVMFFISPFLNYLPLKFSKEAIMLITVALIFLSLIIDFILSFFGDFACHYIAFSFCFGFMLFNAWELKKMDKELQDGLTQEELKKMTDNWCFDLFVNFIGMIYFAEAVRLVAKITSIVPQQKGIKKAVS